MSHDLRIERIFDAPAEEVFDAFVDPDTQRELYADAPNWIVESECDLRPGGRWTVTFGPPGREPAREVNVFEVVDRPRRLVFASTMTMPDGSSFTTLVEVGFEMLDGRTRLTILQSRFPTPELRDEISGGWPSILDGLARVLRAKVME